MTAVEPVDLSNLVLDIHSNCSVTTRVRKPGPPERINGMTLGVVNMAPGESPHAGEMHPDGDEILFVVSGRLQVRYDSSDTPAEFSAGQACIVRQGEWHLVDCLQPTTLMHITPGPNGEARFN